MDWTTIHGKFLDSHCTMQHNAWRRTLSQIDFPTRAIAAILTILSAFPLLVFTQSFQQLFSKGCWRFTAWHAVLERGFEGSHSARLSQRGSYRDPIPCTHSDVIHFGGPNVAIHEDPIFLLSRAQGQGHGLRTATTCKICDMCYLWEGYDQFDGEVGTTGLPKCWNHNYCFCSGGQRSEDCQHCDRLRMMRKEGLKVYVSKTWAGKFEQVNHLMTVPLRDGDRIWPGSRFTKLMKGMAWIDSRNTIHTDAADANGDHGERASGPNWAI